MHLEPSESRILEIIWNHHAMGMTHIVWGGEVPGTYQSLLDTQMIERRLDTEAGSVQMHSYHLTPKGMLVAKSMFPHPKDV